jgi:trk system potassium uptake protein TrkH
MSLARVANVVGLLQVFVSLSMFLAAGVGFVYGDGDALGILLAGVVTFFVGGFTYSITMFEGELTHREGFAIVTMAWTAAAAFGALPYLFTGALDSPVAAFFEAMSGFTTTGASVFTDVEALPHGVLFWRSLTQWLGGMGIIVLVIAVLPYLGVGGMQLFKAEVPGPTPERLRPRITQTAKLLWLVYVGLTAAEIVLYLMGGMSFFDAVNHSFTTLATGGFSTRNESMASFDSSFIHWVTIIFMYLAGVNFSLHFRAATGRPVYFRDHEWRFYTYIVLLAAVSIAGVNLVSGGYSGLEPAVRDALFQATSIATTTGFVSTDYELWVSGAQMVLFALFFVGGMAGSTGGGIKAMRVLLLVKQTAIELRKQLHPRAVLLTRVGDKTVKPEVLANVTGFVILYLLFCLAGAIVLGFLGMDPLTAIAASISSIGNVGPGFGDVGGTDNYGWMSDPALVVLSFFMLVGRLEIYTVLLLFHPETWKARRSFQ